MKRLCSNFIAALLVCAGFSFTGCELFPSETEIANETLGQTTSTGSTLINGFEVFDRDVQLIKLFNEFGQLQQNKDKQYVKSGESSLHVRPFGGRINENTANPFFLLPTTSTRFSELGFGDFRKVDEISFWIYNAEESALNVGVGLQVGRISSVSGCPVYDIVQTTSMEYYSLRSGWNFIEYEVLPADLELQGVTLEAVSNIAFEFDYVWSNDFADAPDLYLDEVGLTYLETEKTGTVDIPITKTKTQDGFDSWTIFDFETDNVCKFFYYAIDFPSPMAAEPVIKQVFAGDYGAVAGDKGQVMLWRLKHGGGQRGDSPVVFMRGEVMQKALETIGEDIKENPQNYAFKFDIYSAAKVDERIALEYDGAVTWDTCSLPRGEWTTYSIKFSVINQYALTDTVFTEKPGKVRFAWGDFSTEENIEDREYLFDNFRIEKIA